MSNIHDLSAYQRQAAAFARYPADKALDYLVPSQAHEVWEFRRERDGSLEEKLEAGDVLWMGVMILRELGIDTVTVDVNTVCKYPPYPMMDHAMEAVDVWTKCVRDRGGVLSVDDRKRLVSATLKTMASVLRYTGARGWTVADVCAVNIDKLTARQRERETVS